MANKPALMAWDSCVVIDCIQKTAGGPYKFIQPLVDDAEAEKLLIVVSSLAISEAFFIREIPAEDQQAIIDQFFDYPWVRIEAAGMVVCKIAQRIRRQGHALEGLDSIHLATAIATGANVFLTYDGEARKKKKKPLLPLDNLIALDGGPPLRIRTPERQQQILCEEAHPLIPATAPIIPIGEPIRKLDLT